jgi:thiol-disulfide isomerase/thioredoxin
MPSKNTSDSLKMDLFVKKLCMAGALVVATFFAFSFLGDSNEPSTGYVFTFYLLPRCPYCVTAKPEWNALKSSYGSSVSFREVDSGTDRAEAKSLGIEAFPTFVLTAPDGTKSFYEGERTAEAWSDYLRAMT